MRQPTGFLIFGLDETLLSSPLRKSFIIPFYSYAGFQLLKDKNKHKSILYHLFNYQNRHNLYIKTITTCLISDDPLRHSKKHTQPH